MPHLALQESYEGAPDCGFGVGTPDLPGAGIYSLGPRLERGRATYGRAPGALKEGTRRMTPEETIRLRAVLDRLVREKEIAAQYFARVGLALDDVDQRRWFRRMAQDEKDQRKILIKHRRELCGHVVPQAVAAVSSAHASAEGFTRSGTAVFVDVVRTAVVLAEESRVFTLQASDIAGERSCRIFLKILGQESGVRRDELLNVLREIEALGEPVAA